VTSHSANRNGVAFALGDLVIDLADVRDLPCGVMPVTDDDIGRFDEGPLHILIGRLAHVAEAGLAPAAVDGGDEAGVAGELP